MSFFLDSTLKVSLVVLVGLGAAWLFRNRSSAARHWILATTFLCASMTPVLELMLPAWGIPSSPDRAAVSRAGTTGPSSTGLAAAGAATDSVEITTQPMPPRGIGTHAVLLPAWLTGAAISFLVLLAGFGRLAWLVARAEVIAAGRWTAIVTEVEREYSLRRPVRLLVSGHPSLLVTWGFVWPSVIIPRAALNWSDERIRIVLRHELAHIRRGDWIVQIAGEALRAVYWFNPLLWVACARLRQESEQACDDEVLACVEGSDYAQHLVELARALKSEAAPRVPAPAIARTSSLERRIRAMLDTRLSRTRTTRGLRWLTFAAMLSLTAGIAAAQTSPVTLSGSVFDTAGKPVADVTVGLVNEQTQARHEVTTDQRGSYVFVPLPAGAYRLDTKFPGFARMNELVVLSGQKLRRDLTMPLGGLSETVVVGRGTDEQLLDKIHMTMAEGAARTNPDGTATIDATLRVKVIDTPKVTQLATRDAFEKALAECQPSANGGQIRPPRKIQDVRPVYPPALMSAGVGGVVVLKAVIGTDGTVRDASVERSVHPDLDAAAVDAVRSWRFDGTLLNCQPVDVTMTVSMKFEPPASGR
jgi:TonB family protein